MNIYEAFYNQAKDYLEGKEDKEIVAKLRVAADFVAQMEKMGVQPSAPQTAPRTPQNAPQSVSGSTLERLKKVGPIEHPRTNKMQVVSSDPMQAGLDIVNPDK